MSRSYRHSRVFYCEQATGNRLKAAKREASRRVRHASGLYQNSDYKKLFCSYEFRLFRRFVDDEREYVADCVRYGDDERDAVRWYRRLMGK